MKEVNFELGVECYDASHYALAFTFFQRSADRGHRTVESLLRCADILALQGGRDQKEYDLIEHAVTVSGLRSPEAWLAKAQYHCRRDEWTSCQLTCLTANELLPNGGNPIISKILTISQKKLKFN